MHFKFDYQSAFIEHSSSKDGGNPERIWLPTKINHLAGEKKSKKCQVKRNSEKATAFEEQVHN